MSTTFSPLGTVHSYINPGAGTEPKDFIDLSSLTLKIISNANYLNVCPFSPSMLARGCKKYTLKKSYHVKSMTSLQTYVLPHQVTKCTFTNFFLQKQIRESNKKR